MPFQNEFVACGLQSLEHSIKSPVKHEMKLVMKFIVLTVFMSVSGIAIAEITAPPLWQNGNSSDSFEISTDQFLTGSNSAPIISAERPAASQALKPGIYQTKPFTCIVVVPEAQHDDCCITGGADGVSKMPIREPSLQFIPLSQMGK